MSRAEALQPQAGDYSSRSGELREGAYADALDIGFALAEQAGLELGQARFALGIVLATQHLLQPVISDLNFAASPLLEVTGGEPDNPHRKIDAVGGRLMDLSVANRAAWLEQGSRLFVEERKAWQEAGIAVDSGMLQEEKVDPYYIIQDPCDETSGLTKEQYFQTTAVTVTDHRFKFIASAWASLVDGTVFVVEKNSPHLYLLDSGSDILTEVSLPDRSVYQSGSLRIATLERRIPDLLRQGFLQLASEVTLQTFGGFAAMQLVLGNLDVMIDPLTGQPWYEAVHWGWPLHQAGYYVRNDRGDSLDFGQTVRQSLESVDQPRVKLIIAGSQAQGEVFMSRTALR